MNRIVVCALGVIMLIVCACLYTKVIALQNDLTIYQNNNKAYYTEISNLKNECYMYKFTIDQLNYFNDSIVEKLKDAKEELKIKNKDIKQLQYLNSKTSKKDTIVLTDTVFKNNVNLDTIFGDEWYIVKLGLKYPKTISIEPTFKNETIVLVSSKKETVDPPKKWWIQRLFQKKHTIVKIDVIENNPYTEIKEQKFIEIIK